MITSLLGMRNSVELTDARKYLSTQHLPGLVRTQLWNERGDCHGRCKERVLKSVSQDTKIIYINIYIYTYILIIIYNIIFWLHLLTSVKSKRFCSPMCLE